MINETLISNLISIGCTGTIFCSLFNEYMLQISELKRSTLVYVSSETNMLYQIK